jgi:hypothetical protein
VRLREVVTNTLSVKCSWCEWMCVGCEQYSKWCEALALGVKFILVGVNKCVGCEQYSMWCDMWCEALTLGVNCILVGVNKCVPGVNYIACGVKHRHWV